MESKKTKNEMEQNANINNWDVKNSTSYERLIPKQMIEGYKIDAGIITTYSLDMHALNHLILSLDCASIMNGGIDVFYDVQGLRMDEDDYKPIPENCLHGVVLYNGNVKYAFHPKVILLRYVGLEHNGVRYVMVVSSKNVTVSNCLDAFCVVYGDVKTTDGDVHRHRKLDAYEESGVCNGDAVYHFVEELYVCAGVGEDTKWVDLQTVHFKCADENVTKVDFLTGGQIYDKIQNLQDVIVVSPFLSQEFLGQKNIKKVISTSYGFGRLGLDLNHELLNNCHQFIEGNHTELHAKIYYGLPSKQEGLQQDEEEYALCIIGSSNATNNGCLLQNKSKNVNASVGRNMEYNVALTVSRSGYEQFEAALTNVITEDILCEEKGDSEDSSRHVLGAFLGAIENIQIGKEDEVWQLKICFKEDIVHVKLPISVDGNEERDSALYISMNDNEESDWVAISNHSCTITTHHPKDSFFVKIGEMKYCIRVAMYIEQDVLGKEYINILEELHKADFVEIMKKVIDGVLEESRLKNYKRLKKEQEGSKFLNYHRYREKQYVFEKLKRLALKVWAQMPETYVENKDERWKEHKKRYRERLNQLKSYLLLIKDHSEESKDMLDAIDKILEGE